MEIDEIIEILNDTSCDFHCGYGEEIKTVECKQDCGICEAVREAVKILEKLKTEPKIKLLSRIEATEKVACTTPYSVYAWLKDIESIEDAGLRICEVQSEGKADTSCIEEIFEKHDILKKRFNMPMSKIEIKPESEKIEE